MTYLNTFRLKFFSIALLASTALAASASALDLPDITPEQISQDSQRTYNETLGRSEVVAPSFDPFESADGLAGTAALRSAGNAITIDGRNVSGGAFLDLAMIYTNASSDPYDTRGINGGVFLSGQPVDVIRRDNRTLDCSENVREVVYDDGYYNGAYSGYIGGIFRTYPRYRGHRGYGHSYRGGRSIFSGRSYNSRSRRHNERKYRRGDRGQDHQGRHRRADNDDDSHRRDRRADRDRSRDRDGTRDRTRDRDRDRNRDRSRDRDRRGDDDTRSRERRSERRDVSRTDRSRETRSDRNTRSDRGTRTDRSTRPDRRTYERRARSDRRTPEMNIPPPAQPRPQVTRTRQPVVSPPPPPPPPKPRVRQRNVDRAVDRHFKKPTPRIPHNRIGNRVLNFFPMQFRTYSPNRQVYVNTRCAREETLTLHIPQERLDAARFDGMTVLLLDREAREIPVFIPPNYIEGFRQAASNITYPVRSLPTGPIYSEPVYTDPPAEPLHGSDYLGRSDELPRPAPEYRDPRQPIIYGGSSSVTVPTQPSYQGYPTQ